MATRATDLTSAVNLFVPDTNRIHDIINGDATTEVAVENGFIPSIRKVYADTLYFLSGVEPWVQGQEAVSPQQLYNFGGLLYWAPSATASNTVTLGSTPVGDTNWQVAPTRWNYLQAVAITYNTTTDNVALLQTGVIDTENGVNYLYDADNEVVYFSGQSLTGTIQSISSPVNSIISISTSEGDFTVVNIKSLLPKNNIISDINELKALPNPVCKVVKRLTVTSYLSGWSILSKGARGGGEFIYIEGSALDDGVVNFASDDGLGSWKRVNFDINSIECSDAGMHPDQTASLNDVAKDRLVSYCSNNNLGFKVSDEYNLTTGIDLDGIRFLKGEKSLEDGFVFENFTSDALTLSNYVVIENFHIIGPVTDQTMNVDNGSVGLKGAPYLAKGKNVRIQGFGTGHHWFDSVDSHYENFWIQRCHRAVLLDGFLSNAEFSSTGSYTDTEIHGNFDGVITGQFGLENTAFVSFNFHNCIFENNARNALVCADTVTLQDNSVISYGTKELRFLSFTGYVWFEDNDVAFDLTRCRGVQWMCTRRIEGVQLFKYPEFADDNARYEYDGSKFGTSREERQLELGFEGINKYFNVFASAGSKLLRNDVLDAQGNVKASVSIVQELDYSIVGRRTGFRVDLYGDNEVGEEASNKLDMSRNGDLLIAGSYSPFTGTHPFFSASKIKKGTVVKIESADHFIVEADETTLRCSGTCVVDDTVDNKASLGVVERCEKVSSGYIVFVAAVGDSLTANLKNLEVNGEFEVGDYLSSDGLGGLKVYEGNDMRCVIAHVKGKTSDNKAYCYFK